MPLFRRLVLVIALACTAAPAGAADADALFREVLGTVGAVQGLRGRFVQTARMAATGFDQVAGGRVWFARGGRMRWEYEGDDPQVIVSDGEVLWIHQVRDRTVIRQRLEDLPPTGRLALDLLSGLGRARDHFEIGACGDRCLVLRPSTPQPDLDRVEIRLLADRALPASVTTYDPLGNRTVIEFSGLTEAASLPESLFRFRVPDGAQVVNGSEVGR